MVKIDSNNYQQVNPLQDLEDRNYELKKQYNTWFLTLLRFIITTNWVIISVENVSICVKYCLCVSIILLVIWLTIFFYISSLETKRIEESMKCMRKWNMSDNLWDMNEEIEILNKIRKKSSLEKVFNWISKICLYCWILIFLVGIIIFMYSISGGAENWTPV